MYARIYLMFPREVAVYDHFTRKHKIHTLKTNHEFAKMSRNIQQAKQYYIHKITAHSVRWFMHYIKYNTMDINTLYTTANCCESTHNHECSRYKCTSWK